VHFVNQFTSNRVKIVRRKITQLISTWCCEGKNKLHTYNVATNKVAICMIIIYYFLSGSFDALFTSQLHALSWSEGRPSDPLSQLFFTDTT
jgi:hypothetical protein